LQKYKINFASNDYISASAYNLLIFLYPELNYKRWEMERTDSNYWTNYNNFIEAVKFYYNEILDEDMKQNIN